MQYTFKQAQDALVASTGAYGASDIKVSINRAIQALASMSGWECLRKVLRFSSVGPGFVLPQGCAGLVRACVNGRPTTVRGQDFRFLQSGPGDIRRPPNGFCPIKASNIYDLGMKPVMVEPGGWFRLFAMIDKSDVVQPTLVVKGIDPDGHQVAVRLPPHTARVYDPLTGEPTSEGEDPEDIEPNPQLFQQITEVTLLEGSSKPYYLYAVDSVSGHAYMISMYNPEVKAPQFRHYEIVGVARNQPIELLVETRIDPLPLIEDTDVLPFSTLEPIEWMIRADWQMKAGEVSAAQKYQDMAARWLKAQEVTDDTVQTSIVINSVFEGSPGEVSAESWNI